MDRLRAQHGDLKAVFQQRLSAMTGADASLARLMETLGHCFIDPSLLEEALTHPSDGNAARPDYERLEFLGDAVLGQVVATWLYDEMPDASEGELTRARAA